MQDRTLKALALVFVALLLIWGAKMYVQHRTRPLSPYTEKVRSHNPTAVQTIVLRNTQGTVALKKEDGAWKLNGKKADTSKVEHLVETLFPTIAPELIAQTDKRHEEFQITDTQATTVMVDDALTWFVGKSEGVYIYARLDSDANVYLLRAGTASTFSTDASDWYDKTILAFDQARTSKLTMNLRGETRSLVNKDGTWVEESSGKETKKDTVNSLLSHLSNFWAESLYDGADGVSYQTKPELSITVEYDGVSETLQFFKGTSDYLVQRISDQERFTIREYSASSILSSTKEILDAQ